MRTKKKKLVKKKSAKRSKPTTAMVKRIERNPAQVVDAAEQFQNMLPATIRISVQTLFLEAIANKLPVSELEKILTLREMLRAEWAEGEFARAFAAFHAVCPAIIKTRKVYDKAERGGGLRYAYEPFDGIVAQVKKPLSDNGFSWSFETEQDDDSMKVTCILIHAAGHSRTSSFAVPIEPDDYMSGPQKVGSASTYAKRYSFLAVLGISAEDDTDAIEEKERQALKRAGRSAPAKTAKAEGQGKPVGQPASIVDKKQLLDFYRRMREYGIALVDQDEIKFQEWLMRETKAAGCRENAMLQKMYDAEGLKLWKHLKDEVEEFERLTVKKEDKS